MVRRGRHGFLLAIVVCAAIVAGSVVGVASSAPWVGKWLGTYRMQHGGWKGTLIINTPAIMTWNGPNLEIEYIGDDGNVFGGYGYVQGPTYQAGPELIDPVEFLIENADSAIGIRFTIDFANTPLTDGDDTMFIGYLMDGDRMAGSLKNVGYSRSFGWYAVRKGAPGSVW